MYPHVNYLVVFAASVASMVVGFVWYSRPLFGNLWMRIIGRDKISPAESEQMRREMQPYFALVYIAGFIGAAVLARFMAWFGAVTVGGGLRIAFFAWLGFTLPVTLGNALFSGKDREHVWPMFFVQAGHELAALLVSGAILGAWM
ncbi:MAG: DUF1761 domain-containing protein [Nitrospirota bacterium]